MGAMYGKKSYLDIIDFANDLLFAMKFGTLNEPFSMETGRIPIIFVVHSMGGLVAKKATILAHSLIQHANMAPAIRAIIFLATPHHGSQFAGLLNRILRASARIYAPKVYIAELRAGSPGLEEMNEQLQNSVPGLKIFCFYEEQPTRVGPVSIMVVQKESATLGYPGEVVQSINADHHSVCKFSTRDDGYIIVKEALQELVRRFPEPDGLDDQAYSEVERLKTFLPLPHKTDEDLKFFLAKKMEGSCEWGSRNPKLNAWITDTDPESRILWCTGRPGAGKSVLASSIIDHLKAIRKPCAYFFFRRDVAENRSLTDFLRSLAYQAAVHVPGFRRNLLLLLREWFGFRQAGGQLLWRQVFRDILFKSDHNQPLFLVVDGVDECDEPSMPVRLFSGLRVSSLPVRVIFVSRETHEITSAFARIDGLVNFDKVEMDVDNIDIQRYVHGQMNCIPGQPSFQERIKTFMLGKAEGNFLWVFLLCDKLSHCHTLDAAKEIFNNVLPEVEAVYHRMTLLLFGSMRPRNLPLARIIFTWTTYAKRPLSLDELLIALQPEYEGMLDLRRTIITLCGGFIVASKTGVRPIHFTARKFLVSHPDLEFMPPRCDAHATMFQKCISVLLYASFQADIDPVLENPFLSYVATSWPYHLQRCKDKSYVFPILYKFLQDGSVLSWIYILGVVDQLQVPIQAFRIIRSFARRHARYTSLEKTTFSHWSTIDTLVSRNIEAIHIIQRFGGLLARFPKAIFYIVPAFCSRRSPFYHQITPRHSTDLTVVTDLRDLEMVTTLPRFRSLLPCASREHLSVGTAFLVSGLLAEINAIPPAALAKHGFNRYSCTSNHSGVFDGGQFRKTSPTSLVPVQLLRGESNSGIPIESRRINTKRPGCS